MAQISRPGNFALRVYSLVIKIPAGKVTTYREIARALGSRSCRAVGNALNRNPFAPSVPCHRVVRANGEIGGFAWGSREKARMLKKEGVDISNGKIADFKAIFYTLEK